MSFSFDNLINIVYCFFDDFLVLLLVISPLVLILLLLFIPNYKINELKVLSLVGSFIIFLLSLGLHFVFSFVQIKKHFFTVTVCF